MRTKLKKKHKDRPRTKYASPTTRAAVTNGNTLDPNIDGRSTYARRVRDVIRNHAEDLGGDRVLSQAQRALIRRAAFLQAELEKREVKFALSDGASRLALEHYQRATNTLRRVLLALGIERRSAGLKDITPPAQISNQLKLIPAIMKKHWMVALSDLQYLKQMTGVLSQSLMRTRMKNELLS
jgi:hypothetical protein